MHILLKIMVRLLALETSAAMVNRKLRFGDLSRFVKFHQFLLVVLGVTHGIFKRPYF